MRYGSALLSYWAGICLISTLFNFVGRVSPGTSSFLKKSVVTRKYRQFVGYTDWGFRSVTPLDLIIVGTFIILATVFTFIQLGVWYPDFTTLYSDRQTFNQALGMRSGVLSLYILPIAILFAGRKNFLIWLTGLPHSKFLLFHRWVSRVVIFYVFVHAVSYSVAFSDAGVYRKQQYYDYWNFGIAGMFFGALILVQSLRWIRNRSYNVFVVLHILAVIIYLAMGFWHLNGMAQIYALYFFYVSFAIWAGEWCLRLGCILYTGLSGRSKESNFGISAQIKLQSQMLVVSFHQPAWNIANWSGKFVHVHFFVGWRSLQSLSFKVTGDCMDHGKLNLFSTVHGSLAKYMAELTLQRGNLVQPLDGYVSSANYYEMPVEIVLEASHEHSLMLSAFEEVIYIASGSGITGAYACIYGAMERTKESSKTPHITVVWIISSREERWFDTELKHMASQCMVDVQVIYTEELDPSVDIYQPVISILDEALAQICGPTAVVVSGPTSLNLAAKASVRAVMPKTSQNLEFITDTYAL